MKSRTILGLACAVGTAASATMAAPTLFVTSGSTLYRISLDAPVSGAGVTQFEQFEMGTSLVSLTADDQGRLWGTEVSDSNSNGTYALYSIDSALGNPVLNNEGDFLTGKTSSITWSNGQLFGFVGASREFVSIDAENNSTSLIGPLGTGTLPPASSGWDTATQAFYGLRGTELYRYTVGDELTTDKVATVDFGMSGPSGGEIVDGVYYHAINDGSDMHIFAIDLVSGISTELTSFQVEGSGPVGLAGIVPAPGTLALLSAGGLIGLRRRR